MATEINRVFMGGFPLCGAGAGKKSMKIPATFTSLFWQVIWGAGIQVNNVSVHDQLTPCYWLSDLGDNHTITLLNALPQTGRASDSLFTSLKDADGGNYSAHLNAWNRKALQRRGELNNSQTKQGVAEVFIGGVQWGVIRWSHEVWQRWEPIICTRGNKGVTDESSIGTCE